MSPYMWPLPEGIESPLPAQSARLEQLRRRLLNLYSSWGYLHTSPPVLEFADLFHSESDRVTGGPFELSDPLSGRQLAIRPDATAQVARVRTVQMADVADPVRLCYCLPVAQRTSDSLGAPRLFYQVGLELFGSAAAGADREVMTLMVHSLQQAGLDEIIVSLGHTGFFAALMDAAGIHEQEVRQEFLALLQRRSLPELTSLARQMGMRKKEDELLRLLAGAQGEAGQLEEIAAPFTELKGGKQAVAELTRLSAAVPAGCRVQFALTEVHGKLYHRGAVFACFTPGYGAAVARGGRFLAPDQSPAVGFSASLWLLAALAHPSGDEQRQVVLAPADSDADLEQQIESLRQQGAVVIRELEGQETGTSVGMTHRLQKQRDAWTLSPVAADGEETS